MIEFVIMLALLIVCISVLVIYNNGKKETRGDVVGFGEEKSFSRTNISETLKSFMSYAMFIFSSADLLVTNSGSNTCERKKITMRYSLGNDEMIISKEEARFS